MIRYVTEKGIFGAASKVSTKKDHPYKIGKKSHVICVYTYNWKDEKDVDDIRKKLAKLGITWRIPYKTVKATQEGKYRVLGDEKISKYYY